MNSQPLDMGNGDVFSILLKLGGPAMISMFFQNLYALVDTVFVSWLGTDELAALSLSIPLLFIGMALSKGVAVGSTALISHARGAGDYKEAGTVLKAALPLAMVILCPLCLLAFRTVNLPIFGLFDISNEVLDLVSKFIFWLAWTFPAMGFAFICEGIFLSYGDSKTPMKAMIIGNIFNIVLDPFLIFTCKMGIAGASFASLIGWSISGFIMFAAMSRKGVDRPFLGCSRGSLEYWSKILKIGFPVSLSMLVVPISTAGLNFVLAPFGPAFVGAWALSYRMEQMIALPLGGLSFSLIPFASFNLGMRNSLRIREAAKVCIKSCYGVLLSCGLLVAIFIPNILELFNTSPEITRLATYVLRIATLGYCLAPFELVMTGLAMGLKHPKFSLYTNICRMLFLRLPLAVIFGHIWGGKGVYISHPVSLLTTGAISIFIIKHLLKTIDFECRIKQEA